MQSRHGTLTSLVVATLTFTLPDSRFIEVHHRGGSGSMFYTIDGTTPTENGDDTFVIREGETHRHTHILDEPPVVKMIARGGAILTGQAALTTTAAKLGENLADADIPMIFHHSSEGSGPGAGDPIYIGDSTVSTTTGLEVEKAETIPSVFPAGAELWGVAASGTHPVSFVILGEPVTYSVTVVN